MTYGGRVQFEWSPAGYGDLGTFAELFHPLSYEVRFVECVVRVMQLRLSGVNAPSKETNLDMVSLLILAGTRVLAGLVPRNGCRTRPESAIALGGWHSEVGIYVQRGGRCLRRTD